MLLPVLLVSLGQGLGLDGTPQNPETAILEAFDSAWVVAVGENHGHLEFHDLVLRVLETPGAADVIDDIAVEWGNALYQSVVDRYARGDDVPWDSVTMAWRNTVVSPNTVWDAPVYERFFRAVRRVNAALPRESQYRVLLADSQVDWSQVDSVPQLSPFFDRARSMADVIRRESLREGRRCLFLAGGLHVAKAPRVRRSSRGVPTAEVTPVAWLELHHPGATYVIQSMGRAEELGLADLVGSGAPRLVTTAGSAIGAIPANAATALRNRDGSRPDVYGTSTLADILDAVLLWDPTDLTFPAADPSVYRTDWYWAELNRRSVMLRGEPMDASLRSPHRDPHRSDP